MPPGEHVTKTADAAGTGPGTANVTSSSGTARAVAGSSIAGASGVATGANATQTDGRLTQMCKESLRAIARLSAERAAAESSTRHALNSTLTGADAELSTALSSALSNLETQLNAIRNECDAAAAKARQDADDSVANAKRQFEIDKSQLRERGEADVATAKKAMQEAVWMAETVHDTNIDKPGAAFAKIKAEVERRMGELGVVAQRVERELQELVRPSRKSPRPWREGVVASDVASLAGGTESLASKTLAESFNQQAQAFVEHASRLLSLRAPRAFVSPLPAVYGVLLGLASAGGAVYLQGGAMTEASYAAGFLGLAVGAVGSELIRRQQKARVTALGASITKELLTTEKLAETLVRVADDERKAKELAIRTARDEEVKQARSKCDAVVNEVNTAYTRKRAELEATLKVRLENAAQSREQSAAKVETDRRTRLAQADTDFRTTNQNAKQKHQTVRDEAVSTEATSFEALRTKWVEGMTSALAALDSARKQALSVPGAQRWPGATLDAPLAQFPAPSATPPCITAGQLSLDLRRIQDAIPEDPRLHVTNAKEIPLPSLMEIPDRCSMLVQFGGAGAVDGRSAGLSLLRTTMLRLLLGFPPGKLRFTIVDPVGLGQNFAAFMHLADFDPQLVSDRIWTEPRHIEARLTDLTEHMETVIQKYLRNEFASIEQYNARAGEVAEPYRFLVIADLPASFSETSAKRLASIISSGPKCGVYTLILQDTRHQLPPGITSTDLKRAGLRLSWRKAQPDANSLAPAQASNTQAAGRFVVDDPDLQSLSFTQPEQPSDELFNEIVREVGKRAKDAGRVQVPFSMISPSAEKRWSLSSSEEVTVPLGRAGATRLLNMTLGRGTAQHMLIAGRTGSGKSTLLHVMITNLALWYSPDEVELYLVDFKKGVEFKCYTGTGESAAPALPHARVIAIESEREFGLSVLRKLDAELKRRGELLRDASVQDLKSYRKTANAQVMPRVLLIVDEFQELFVEDDKLAQEAGLLLDRLVRQGRAFGMHVVLGSQTLGGAYSLARATMGQMGVRIALQCSEADSYVILSEDNAAARLLSRPGEAIYNDASGALEGNSLFQISWLDDHQRDQALRAIAVTPPSPIRSTVLPPIVFEGNVPARAERNEILASMLRGRPIVPVPATATGQPSRAHFYLGDPVAIKDPVSAVFRRQSASSLLITGQQEDSAMAMLAVGAAGLAAQHLSAARASASNASNLARFTILDGTTADAPGAGFLPALSATFPSRTQARCVPFRETDAAILELAAEVDRRLASPNAGADEPAHYLLIQGLQRFRTLRKPEDEFDFSADSSASARPDRALARIIKEGPALGIHTIIWSDTVATLNRTFDRATVREFDFRVLFQMAAADAATLVDSPGASTGLIGQNRALLASEELGVVEKFRPYSLPSPEWLATLAQGLRALA